MLLEGLCTKRHRGKERRAASVRSFLPRDAGEGDHAKHGGGGMQALLPPPARFARHLPRIAGEEPLLGSPERGFLCKAPGGGGSQGVNARMARAMPSRGNGHIRACHRRRNKPILV